MIAKEEIFLVVLILLGIGCGTPKTLVIDEIRDLDTLVVTASREPDFDQIQNDLPRYNPSYNRTNDLLHTKLDLKFNWEKEQVLGVATLKLTPLARPQKILQLDAQNFDIHSIKTPSGTEMNYEYVDNIIHINLGKVYQPGETYNVIIDYTANPTVGSGGGSAAITSDQGLFFINPTGEDPFKPQQIWTQGETEWNSRWFPTIDKPNERCTQEIIVTVADKFETLSNGLKIASKNNSDGTRTDHWKMDMPHAPYLFALVVGDYAVIQDRWKDIDVDYYVEAEYEKDARAIFPHTVEMLSFFSDKIGLEYPWPKYSQVVVRDYVSGAMENTTAVIFGEFMQDDQRALVDNSFSEQIVAHEMFHHWFGDYVTCESWSNLTMNEGFANYSEYLWLEHKHGKYAADYHRFTELQGYIQSIAYQGAHPLIHFSYKDKEDMFDAHSYNKGGLILHMLRRYVGDDVFFEALNLYLKDNAFQAVEAHDLRLAFEEVSGEDLNWFWNQWYFSSGHPKLSVSKTISEQKVHMVIEQTQEGRQVPSIFQLPIAVDLIRPDGSTQRETIWLDQRAQTFTFDVDFTPTAVVFDADDTLLAEIDYTPSASEQEAIFHHTDKFIHQYLAYGSLLSSPADKLTEYTNRAINHEFWVLRYLGLNAIQQLPTSKTFTDQILSMAVNDDHVLTRQYALDYIGAEKITAAEQILVDAIQPDMPFDVSKSAIKSLQRINPTKATEACATMSDVDHAGILFWCGQAFVNSGDGKYWSYFDEHIDDVDGVAAEDFFKAYIQLAKDDATKSKVSSNLKKIAEQRYESIDRRAAAFNGYASINDANAIDNIKAQIRQSCAIEDYPLIVQEQ